MTCILIKIGGIERSKLFDMVFVTHNTLFIRSSTLGTLIIGNYWQCKALGKLYGVHVLHMSTVYYIIYTTSCVEMPSISMYEVDIGDIL